MFLEEIDLCLKICDLNARDKASLSMYLQRLMGINVSESITYMIILIQVRNADYYDGHPIPLPSTLLNTTKKRRYISEDPDLTYRTAQKYLTLLGVALLDDDEIFSINELQ